MNNRIWTATAVGLVLLGLGGNAYADDKLIGNVATIDAAAKTFSVQETGATAATTFSVDGKTQIRVGQKEVALSTLEPGRSVKVTYVKSDGVALAHRVDVSVPLGADKSTPMPNRVDGAR
jgi:hypothetical protein